MEMKKKTSTGASIIIQKEEIQTTEDMVKQEQQQVDEDQEGSATIVDVEVVTIVESMITFKSTVLWGT